MIKLQVIGNLGKDAIVNNVNGKSVINFNVAHTEKYRDAQGSQKERTTWVECAYWTDKTAVAPYLKKGTQVYVEGTPDVRTYQTNDGRQGAALSLRITSVQLLGSKPPGGNDDYSNSNNSASSYNTSQPAYNNNNAAYNTSPAPSAPAPDMAEMADDLPF